MQVQNLHLRISREHSLICITYPVTLVKPNSAGLSSTVLNQVWASKLMTMLSEQKIFYTARIVRSVGWPGLDSANRIIWLTNTLLKRLMWSLSCPGLARDPGALSSGGTLRKRCILSPCWAALFFSRTLDSTDFLNKRWKTYNSGKIWIHLCLPEGCKVGYLRLMCYLFFFKDRFEHTNGCIPVAISSVVDSNPPSGKCLIGRMRNDPRSGCNPLIDLIYQRDCKFVMQGEPVR